METTKNLPIIEIAMAVSVIMAVAFLNIPAQTQAFSRADIRFLENVENRIFDLTNKERAKHGLDALKKENTLRTIAREHSSDMFVRDFRDHVNPDGLAPWDRVAISHRTMIGLVSENIYEYWGTGFDDEKRMAENAVEWWMNSPPHRKNILNPESTHLGVGTALRENRVLSTQKFSRVYAYTISPVPEKIRKGAPLNPRAEPFSRKNKKPEMFELLSLDRKKVAGPFKIENGKADAPPGTYIIQYWFPAESGRYTLIRGQRIQITG